MSTGAGPGLSNYPYGFNNGVSIKGVPIAQTHPGKAVWLYNGPFVSPQGRAGADGNDGTWQSPCATLAGALTKCVAQRGDVIFVKPGHSERLSSATALTMSVAGVAVIGLGSGALRPQFILDTVATATINVATDDVSFQNCQFAANFLNIAALFTLGIASVTGAISLQTLTVSIVSSGALYIGSRLVGSGIAANTVITSQVSGTPGGVGVYTVNNSQTFASGAITTTSKGFTLDNCDVGDSSAALNFLNVVTTNAQNNANDQLTITRNRVLLLATSGVVNLLSLLGTVTNVVIADNYYQASTTNAGAFIAFASGKTVTGFQLLRNVMQGVNAVGTATGIVLTSNSSGSTGMIDQNTFHTLANTTLASSLLVTASTGIFFGTNRYARSADKSSVTTLPALDT